ncbi:MAG: hypothetical protein LBI53_03840 [Candidatus Peribacteria bacterium]|jgi:predicted DNA binding CopG/RHH family protein|nr:hypothetical protein [Candidatus Peribacteria bacterium]
MLNYDNQNLDEQELERDTYTSSMSSRELNAKQLEEEKKRLSTYTVQKPKKKSISIRLLATDLMKLKTKAETMGVPYQTLIALELHKIVN